MKHEKLYRKSISIHGQYMQMIKTIEECAELQKALSKLLIKWNDKDHGNAIEEIADVQIMINQMKLIFGRDQVKKVMNEKILRLKTKLHGTPTEMPELPPQIVFISTAQSNKPEQK